MKKFFRMALVLALAGSALLYTSCTKDYSPDIQEVQKKVDQVNSDLQTALSTLEGVKNDISGLKSADTDLQKKIDDTNKALNDAITAINKSIADGDTEVKGYVDQKIATVRREMGDLKTELEGKIQDLADQHDIDINELWDALDDLKTDHAADIEDLQGQIDDINDAIDDLVDDLLELKRNHNTDIQDLQGKINIINGKIDDINDAIDDLEDAIDGLEDRVDTLEGDVSGLKTDMAKVKDDISDLQEALEDLEEKLEGEINDLDEKLQGEIDDLDGKIDEAIENLGQKIDDAVEDLEQKIENVETSLGQLAQKHDRELSELKTNLEGQISDAKTELEGKIQAVADDLKNVYDIELPALKTAIEALEGAEEDLAGLFATYAEFIQSIAYIPASSNGVIAVSPVRLTNGNLAKPVLVASFKITPAKAVARVTENSANIVAVATRAAAAPEDTLKITKIVAREDAPGYVDVYAAFEQGTTNNFAIALTVSQVENTLLEEVTSDYAPVTISNNNPIDLRFDIFDAADDSQVARNATVVDQADVRVSPTSAEDSVKVFTEGKWIVKANVFNEFRTPEELAALLDAPIAGVSPVAGDTVITVSNQYANRGWFSHDNEGFETSVFPTDRTKEPHNKGIIDILVDHQNATTYPIRAQISNGHLGGQERNRRSGRITSTYHAVPDTLKFDFVPAELVSIAWDYKYWDNIADTTIKGMAVPEGIAALIADADTTSNTNKVSEIDYTESGREAYVGVNAEDANKVDAQILSDYAYGEADSTFTYVAEKFNTTNATQYYGTFDYVVKARPADAVITLPAVDTFVRFSSRIALDNIQALNAAYTEHASYYANYEKAEVLADMASDITKDSLVVYFNGERLGTEGVNFAQLTINGEGAETSQLSANLTQVGLYEFKLYTNVFGINYTFVLPVNVANNPARLTYKPTYVKVDNAETKDWSVKVTGDVNSSFHYYLVDQFFWDYVKVINLAPGNYPVRESLSVIFTPEEVAAADVTVVPSDGRTYIDPIPDTNEANIRRDMRISWNDFDSLQFKVAARLVPTYATDFTIDTATVRLWTVDPIPVFNGGDGVIAWHEADQLATANVWASINLADFNGIALADDAGLLSIGPDAESGETIVDYDQAITFGEPMIVSGVDHMEEINLSFNAASGVVSLRVNQGVIVEPIIVKIPVALNYMLDRGLDKTTYVYVAFQEVGTTPVLPLVQ